MTLKSIDVFRRVYRYLFLWVCVMSLSACSSMIETRVTTFQNWPDDGMKSTWFFDPLPLQANSLEHQAYQNIVRQAIANTGLQEAKNLSDARFLIRLEYATNSEIRASQQWVTDPFPQRTWVTVQGRDGVWRQHRVEQVTPNQRLETVAQTMFQSSLRIQIRDVKQSESVVYEATAVHVGDNDVMLEVMPWLARSIFDYFPDPTGTVRHVRFERK